MQRFIYCAFRERAPLNSLGRLNVTDIHVMLLTVIYSYSAFKLNSSRLLGFCMFILFLSEPPKHHLERYRRLKVIS